MHNDYCKDENCPYHNCDLCKETWKCNDIGECPCAKCDVKQEQTLTQRIIKEYCESFQRMYTNKLNSDYRDCISKMCFLDNILSDLILKLNGLIQVDDFNPKDIKPLLDLVDDARMKNMLG